jgi:hypothetical protein
MQNANMLINRSYRKGKRVLLGACTWGGPYSYEFADKVPADLKRFSISSPPIPQTDLRDEKAQSTMVQEIKRR